MPYLIMELLYTIKKIERLNCMEKSLLLILKNNGKRLLFENIYYLNVSRPII
jgi:hypothetical protein